jgi:Phage terminase large subunit
MTEERTPAGELLTTLEDHAKGSDASEPLAVVESWEDMGLLPPELFAQLTAEEQDDYLALIEAEHGHVWTLADSPKQLLAQELAPKIDYLYYGGAAGGGKTELAMYHTHELSLRFPGHTTLMLRTTLPELRRSIIRRFSIRLIELGLQQAVRLRKIDNMTAFYYPNGSVIEFGYCSNDEQVGQYLSAEYDLLVMDEASLFSPYAIQMITSRVRTTRRKRKMGIYPHVMYLSNPGGPAHLYLRKFAFDSTNRGESIAIFDVRNGISSEDVLQGKAKPVRLEPMPATPLEARQLELDLSDDEVTVAFIPAKVADNPHIDLGYRNRLAALPEVRRRQMLDGDMMVAEGAAFPEWDPEIHTCEPFEIPPTWDRAAGIDYGWAKPAAIMWGAWDENGTCYLYREDKVLQHAPTEQAKRWLAMEVENGVKMPPRLRMADPSTHASTQGQGVAVPVASQWRHQGFQTRKAPNPRIPGWSNVHSYLAPRSIEHPDGTTEMKPRLVVFTTCTYAIEQLSTIPADKHEPDDVDTNVDDHGADAIRYLLSAVPIREIKRNAPARPEVSGARGRVERYVDRQKRSRRTR